MKNSGANITELKDRSNFAYPYKDNREPCDEKECLFDFGIVNPSGGLYSSVADLAKILSLMLSNKEKDGKK